MRAQCVLGARGVAGSGEAAQKDDDESGSDVEVVFSATRKVSAKSATLGRLD